ncbi:MAG TPA: hypothetical protein VND93_30735 [Myxococcales bacterium]|nr:hypothetical protein [Myxococcales bacterium]
MSTPMPPRLPECPKDLDLERALAGEAAFTPLLTHAASCPSCTQRLAWMREAGEHFARRVLPATREAVLQAIHRPPWWRRAWPVLVAAPAAVAAVLALVLFTPPRDPGYVGIKGLAAGGPAPLPLQVFVDRSGKAQELRPGDRVHPGDGLRFVVDAPDREVVLLSIDAQGQVSRLVPGGTAHVPQTGIIPGGSVLDGVLGPERIFAVELQPGMDVPAVEAALREAMRRGGEQAVRDTGALPLRAPQGTLLLEKVAP